MPVNETIERVVFEGVDKITPASSAAAKSVQSLRQGLGEVKGALGALGIAVTGAGLVAMYKDTLNVIAGLDTMSEATGGSVEKLSAIQRVAKVGAHDFEGLSGQIGLTIKGLREGTDEGTRAGQAFNFLGVKVRENDGRFRDTAQILIEFAQKLEGVSARADRVLLVQDALGKGAQRYIPLLKDIAAGTDLVATTTAEQAKRADEAEKSIRRMNVALEDSRREFVNNYAPAVRQLAEEMAYLIRTTGGVTGAFAMGFRDLGRGFRSPGEQIGVLNDELERLRKEAAAFEQRGDKGLARGVQATIASKERYKAYLQFLQRQEAEDLAGPGSLDARDLKARGPVAEGKAYQPIDPAELRKRQQELIEAAIRARSEGAFDQAQRELNPFYLSPEEKEKAGAAWVKSIVDIQKDVAAKISKFQLDPTMDDDALGDPERDARLVRLRQSLMTAEEMEQENFRRQMGELESFNQQELALRGGFTAVKERLEDDHLRRMADLRAARRQQELSGAATMFGNLASLTQTGSRRLFEIGKAAAIAETIIYTFSSAQKAFDDGARINFWVGVAYAAAATIAGMVRVAAISSTNIGSGGGAMGVYNASPTSGAPQPQQAAAPAPSRQVTFFVQIKGKGGVSSESLKEFFEMANEEIKDGARFVVEPA